MTTPARSHSPAHLPRISPLMMRFFLSVFRRQVRSSFHAMRLMRPEIHQPMPRTDGHGPRGTEHHDAASQPAPGAIPSQLDDPIALAQSLPMRPTVVVMNHPSWWDPATGMVLHDLLYPQRRQFAPVDERAIERYRFLGKIGCFAVEPDTARGAKQFLRAGDAILSHDDAMLWMTAQGKFTDARQRPVVLRRGVGTLAQRHRRAVFIPLAVEYTFWDQKRPEVLFAFGRPLCADPPRTQGVATMPLTSPPSSDASTWTDCIAAELTEAQDRLRNAAMSRDPDRFATVLEGRSGISGIYDIWRRARAAMRGKRFDPAHQVYDRHPDSGRNAAYDHNAHCDRTPHDDHHADCDRTPRDDRNAPRSTASRTSPGSGRDAGDDCNPTGPQQPVTGGAWCDERGRGASADPPRSHFAAGN